MLWTDFARSLRTAAIGGAVLVAGLAGPVFARDKPTTKLVSCGQESCLFVSGRRADAAAPVLINGRVVSVEGARKWRVRVPVSTVRAWSAPFATSVTVSVADASTQARLPMGMFARPETLAMLVVTAK